VLYHTVQIRKKFKYGLPDNIKKKDIDFNFSYRDIYVSLHC